MTIFNAGARCLCMLSTWFVFVVGAMCSSVYCLPPPVLLTNHVFQWLHLSPSPLSFVSLFSLLVSAVLCWSVVLRCACYVDCANSALPACFFPLRGCFCSILFHFMIKTNHSLALDSSPSLSPISLWQNGSARWGLRRGGNRQPWVQGGSFSTSARRLEHWGLCQAFVGGLPVGYGKGLPHVFFLGGLAKPFKSLMPYWHPEESLEEYINLALHPSSSAFRVELAPEPAPSVSPRSPLQSPLLPWAHAVRSRARSIPSHAVRSRALSVPWAHAVRSRARSVPWAHAVCSRARSIPWAHAVRSIPGAHAVRSVLFREPTQSAPVREPHRGLCHGPAGVPGLATRCLCVLSTCLVVCCWCHVLLCLLSAPPPVLLTNHHCFSGSTCVSLVTPRLLPI